MRAGARDQRAALCGGVAEPRPQLARLLDRLRHVRGDGGGDLEHRLEKLRLDSLVAGRLGHLVEARDELVALRREELELLLDADAERAAAPKAHLHGARQRSRLSYRDGACARFSASSARRVPSTMFASFSYATSQLRVRRPQSGFTEMRSGPSSSAA